MILLTVITIALIVHIGVALLLFDSNTLNTWEIRFYVVVFFEFMAIMTFGVLRLYNAVVVNSQLLLKLKQSFSLLDRSNSDLGRALNTLKSTFTKLNDSVKDLRDSMNKKRNEDLRGRIK